MQPHQERVVQEKAELDTKLNALRAFINSPKFSDVVDSNECIRLIRQEKIMAEYSNILSERIAAF